MLMSERIRINDAPAALLTHCRALSPDCAKSIVKRPSRMSRLNCWRLNIGFVVNDKNKKSHLSATALLEFGEFAGPGINLDRPGVPLDDNVVA